ISQNCGFVTVIATCFKYHEEIEQIRSKSDILMVDQRFFIILTSTYLESMLLQQHCGDVFSLHLQ
ncbi:hypothetical protein ACFLZT_08430, partial [Thermodesulfobacteriota bacterium]